jgi:SAM-dependent methyltransferase
VEKVSEEEMASYAMAGPLPRPWGPSAWLKPPRQGLLEMREIAASRLQGSGIEFGAGTSPVPVPVSCEVKFADFIPKDQLEARAYAGQDDGFVPLSYVTSLDEMAGIANGSLDFVIACHVIEHIRNPLQAFERTFKKLKKGGQFVLMVPDMTRTFDKDRDVTPLEHFLFDYEDPSLERDTEHYVEFFKKAFVTPEDELQARVEKGIADNYDIHFHTWTYESFGEMVEESRRRMSPWRSVWSQPAIDGLAESIEFYFVLEK